MAFDLINSSDILVTHLGQVVKKKSNDYIILQVIFGMMNALLMHFYIVFGWTFASACFSTN